MSDNVPLGKRLWECFDGVDKELAERINEEVCSPLFILGSDPSQGGDETIKHLLEVDGIDEELAEDITKEFHQWWEP